jgi:serine/threonine protein kinase HipA of HipAB toxin-antitoxin module
MTLDDGFGCRFDRLPGEVVLTALDIGSLSQYCSGKKVEN